jgi:hypothetical protein
MAITTMALLLQMRVMLLTSTILLPLEPTTLAFLSPEDITLRQLALL